MDFQIGDVVRLRSGGPTMTVQENDGSEVLCQWFTKDNVVMQGRFPVASVKKYEAAKL
jgi:uncharacterized protein YodC (DUF2158 family)